MSSQPYYTLLASLPPLPRFDQTDRLPITRERLEQRLRMLTPDDAELYEHAVEFLERVWKIRAVKAPTDEKRNHITDEVI